MIKNAVQFTGEHLAVIKSVVEGQTFGAESWSDPSLAPIKSHIKDFYVAEQKYRCCYCQQEIFLGHGRVWDIEHVIPKSKSPDFMFEPRNLSVSCPECNVFKTNIEVTARKYKRFPTGGEKYLIVHPHFDEYEDHIEIIGRFTYNALSKKGSFTIHHCELFRYQQKAANIRKPIRDRRFELDIGQLRHALTEEEARPLVASIMERIRLSEKTNGQDDDC